jgi:hypothetical protein
MRLKIKKDITASLLTERPTSEELKTRTFMELLNLQSMDYDR